MENEQLKYELSDRIEILKGILDSYVNFSIPHEEFIECVWLNAEILAKRFRTEKLNLELKEMETWR